MHEKPPQIKPDHKHDSAQCKRKRNDVPEGSAPLNLPVRKRPADGELAASQKSYPSVYQNFLQTLNDVQHRLDRDKERVREKERTLDAYKNHFLQLYEKLHGKAFEDVQDRGEPGRQE